MVSYPKDWNNDIIDNIADVNTGIRDTQDRVKNGRYPFFIRSSEVQKLDEFDYDCEAVLTVGDGQIGKIFHYVNGKFSAHQRVYVISNFKKIIGKYFFYNFSRFFFNEVMAQTAKTTVDSVRKPMITEMTLRYPADVKEQKIIVKALDSFDTHIKNLSKLIEKKKMIRDGAVEELLSGYKRMKKNKPWKEFKLEEVCVPRGMVRGPFGGSLKKDAFIYKGYKVYEQKNAIYKSINLGDYYIDENKYDELSRFSVKENDFIVSCSGTIGEIYRIPHNYVPGVINQALLKLTIDDNICDFNLFNHYFNWNKFKHKIIDDTQGGAMKNLVGMDKFRKTTIYIPTDTEEQKIIAEILSSMDKEIENLEKEKEKYQQLKSGAMDDLLTGKIRLV